MPPTLRPQPKQHPETVDGSSWVSKGWATSHNITVGSSEVWKEHPPVSHQVPMGLWHWSGTHVVSHPSAQGQSFQCDWYTRKFKEKSEHWEIRLLDKVEFWSTKNHCNTYSLFTLIRTNFCTPLGAILPTVRIHDLHNINLNPSLYFLYDFSKYSKDFQSFPSSLLFSNKRKMSVSNET